MKKHILWGVVAIAISLIAASASAVAAGKTAKMSMPARVAKLERQVKQLRKSSTLQRKLLFAVADATVCLLGPVQPVTAYGDVNYTNTDGFLYHDPASPPDFYVQAYSPTQEGDHVSYYAASIEPKCMKSGSSFKTGQSYQSLQDKLRTVLPAGHATRATLDKAGLR